jgi:branched-subunit amino acid transport protein AzlD
MKPIVMVKPSLLKILSIGMELEAITIFPFIIFAEKPVESLIRHETTHFNQQVKYLVIGFYLVYAFEYLKNRLKGMSHFDAYYQIPFEKEARSNEKI